MSVVLIAVYIYLGGKANSFLNHNLLRVRTVYIFSLTSFIMDKIIWAAILGVITIPVAAILWLFGVGRRK